jgi:hypothetical protein
MLASVEASRVEGGHKMASVDFEEAMQDASVS